MNSKNEIVPFLTSKAVLFFFDSVGLQKWCTMRQNFYNSAAGSVFCLFDNYGQFSKKHKTDH